MIPVKNLFLLEKILIEKNKVWLAGKLYSIKLVTQKLEI